MKFNTLIPEFGVTDISKSLDFYIRILGFSVEYDRKSEGFAFISLGKAQLMLDQIDNSSKGWKTGHLENPFGRGINIQIEVTSIQPLLNRLKKNNVPLFVHPEEKWYQVGNKLLGNKQFLIQDPDGYLLRFFEDLGEKI